MNLLSTLKEAAEAEIKKSVTTRTENMIPISASNLYRLCKLVEDTNAQNRKLLAAYEVLRKACEATAANGAATPCFDEMVHIYTRGTLISIIDKDTALHREAIAEAERLLK